MVFKSTKHNLLLAVFMLVMFYNLDIIICSSCQNLSFDRIEIAFQANFVYCEQVDITTEPLLFLSVVTHSPLVAMSLSDSLRLTARVSLAGLMYNETI